MSPEYLIVGSGLTGAVLARLLRDSGYQVLVVDRRRHIGGNVADELHPSGIRIHKYGPHYFRTSSDRIWEFVNRFSTFYPFEARLMSLVDGQFEHWPIQETYICQTVGVNWKPGYFGTSKNFEEACLSMMPAHVYEKFVKGYSEKQWGVPTTQLDAELAGRFDVRRNNDTRLKTAKYQGLPLNGYTNFMQKMLERIPVLLNFDYLKNRETFKPREMTIYTGPIDEFFDFRLGRLMYRSQKRETIFKEDIDYALPCCQVNNPDGKNGLHIRTIEWKRMMPSKFPASIKGTVLTTETPFSPSNPDAYEYPFPDAANKELYLKYRSLSETIPDLLICGRLGEYRYYDMDQAIGRAMMLFDRIKGMKEIKKTVSHQQEAINAILDLTKDELIKEEKNDSLETGSISLKTKQ